MNNLLKWSVFLWCLIAVVSVAILGLTGCVNQNTFSSQRKNILVDLPDAKDTRPHPPVVSNKHVSLGEFNMNDQGNQIVIKPGNTIHATLNYGFHCPTCKPNLNNQIIIGLANRSAQVCVYNGGPQAQGTADFMLKVPAKPGKYEVRFRGLQANDCQEALRAGWDAETSPSKDATIGTIIVSKKAVV